MRPGVRVAWSAPNHPSALFLAAALPRLDAVFVPLNPRLTDGELRPLLERIGSWRFYDAGSSEGLARASSIRGGEGAESARVNLELTHFILFTSGTTGQPKGACLSLRSFIAGAEASAERLGASYSDRWLCTLPLFHVGGLAMLWRAAHSGGALILHGRFEANAVRVALVEEQVSHLSLVDTTLKRLLETPGPRRFPPSLRAVLVGGGPVSSRRLEEGRARGLPLLQTYGLTETASQACTQEPGALGDETGTPLVGGAVRIMDEDGQALPPHVLGRIELRTPTLFQGYLDDPAATVEAFTPDGWLRTGDLGGLDERGRLCALSRRTDLIVRGGENIYPAELERVLLAYPGVVEVAVLPVADDSWGQVPAAFVVLKGSTPPAEAIHAFCAERLARFKLPARVCFLDALPRNALGKVDRRMLLEELGGPHRCAWGAHY